MNRISACIFPDTRPDAAVFLPFVQVFHQVVYCQPVESTQGTGDTYTPLIDHYLKTRQLRLYPPAPLGEDRDRFLALLNDVQNRRDDYAGQLALLSLADSQPGRLGESRQSIISRLLKSGSIAAIEGEERTMLLWQARLLLKLGEYFDSEQAELDAAFQQLTEKEDTLLTELRMESDSPFSLTGSLKAAGGDADRQLEHRLTAWARLFCLGDTVELEPMVFVTPYADAFERIRDVCDGQTSCRLGAAIDIPLPVQAAPDLVEDNSQTMADAAPFLSILSALCQEKDTSTSLQEWHNHCESTHPGGKETCRTLRLMPVFGRTPAAIFSESFAGLAPSTLAPPRTNSDFVVIGVLEPA